MPRRKVELFLDFLWKGSPLVLTMRSVIISIQYSLLAFSPPVSLYNERVILLYGHFLTPNSSFSVLWCPYQLLSPCMSNFQYVTLEFQSSSLHLLSDRSVVVYCCAEEGTQGFVMLNKYSTVWILWVACHSKCNKYYILPAPGGVSRRRDLGGPEYSLQFK